MVEARVMVGISLKIESFLVLDEPHFVILKELSRVLSCWCRILNEKWKLRREQLAIR